MIRERGPSRQKQSSFVTMDLTTSDAFRAPVRTCWHFTSYSGVHITDFYSIAHLLLSFPSILTTAKQDMWPLPLSALPWLFEVQAWYSYMTLLLNKSPRFTSLQRSKSSHCNSNFSLANITRLLQRLWDPLRRSVNSRIAIYSMWDHWVLWPIFYAQSICEYFRDVVCILIMNGVCISTRQQFIWGQWYSRDCKATECFSKLFLIFSILIFVHWLGSREVGTSLISEPME